MNRDEIESVDAGAASPRASGLVAHAYGFRDGDGYEEPEQPYVCPGCYAVGGEPCAPDCSDAGWDREDDFGDEDDTCIKDDCTECDCSRCEADDRRWESWQGWDAPECGGDADDGEIPF
jgi:hypothetical protein